MDFTPNDFDKRLRGFFENLEPRIQVRALKGSMRKQMSRVRRNAMARVRSSGLSHAPALARTMIGSVGRYGRYFKVSSGFKRKRGQGFYKSKRTGKAVPALLWQDLGTTKRRTKRGLNRGYIMGHNWIAPYRYREISESAENIYKDLQDNMLKVSKRYGFTG